MVTHFFFSELFQTPCKQLSYTNRTVVTYRRCCGINTEWGNTVVSTEVQTIVGCTSVDLEEEVVISTKVSLESLVVLPSRISSEIVL